MGLRNVRRFQLANAALVPEIAEVPRWLVEDFARSRFRLDAGAPLFPSQFQYALEEINNGHADFIGWLLREHPNDIPDCMVSLGDLLQRTHEAAELESILPKAGSEDVTAEGEAENTGQEILREDFEAFGREVFGLSPADPIDSELEVRLLDGIASGDFDIMGWLESRSGLAEAA